MNEIEQAQRRQLDDYTNAGAVPNQPIPSGHALVRPTHGIMPIGAQPVAIKRNLEEVFEELKMLAARAGSEWYYRFPVKKEDGSQSYIEGPSIKLANELLRVYGNCGTEVRELDVGDAWVFYVRFTDVEKGTSQERSYRQRKGQRSMKTKDAERQLDIAYQIGQSKAIRNVVVNMLGSFADYAMEEARNSLVEKVGKDLDAWRKRTVEGLGKIPVEVKRVERVVGRAAKDWLAPDVAQIIGMMKSIHDGMATVDETFPPDQQVEPPKPAPKEDPDTVDRHTGELNPKGLDLFEAGAEAHKLGIPRNRPPGELRAESRATDLQQWTEGWDSGA